MNIDPTLLAGMTPTKDHAIIQVLPKPESQSVSEGGIHLPETEPESMAQMAARHVPVVASIYRAGPDFPYENVLVVVGGGSTIMPSQYDESYKLITPQDVIATIPQA